VERIDVAVIGAGVTGLSSARAMARRGLSVCVLERHPRPGLDTSTHNSGVIHAGIYYPAGTLKAKLSVEGSRLLYAFAAAHHVPHDRCGKIIVATEPDEMSEIEALLFRGRDNGVEGLEIVDRTFIAAREPHVRGVGALFSPNTGVIDAESLVKALLKTAETAGVMFLPATRLAGAKPRPDNGIAIDTGRETILARQVVNAAGLYADEVSAMLGGETFTIYPCRGEYVELIPAKRSYVHALIYPLPFASGHGLGVHSVRTTGGEVWLGPTAEYQARKDDYESHRIPLEAFVKPAQRLLPGITVDDLRLSGSGIRAKLHPPEQSFADFLIRRDRRNAAVIQVAGIDSPGLTSCLAIGELVARIAAENSFTSFP
jgi:L-2-hydroxyglutarate oxidase LhgO